MKQLLTSAGFAAMLLLCAVFCQAQTKDYKEYSSCSEWATYKGKKNHGMNHCVGWVYIREYKNGKKDTVGWQPAITVLMGDEIKSYPKLSERGKYIVDSLKEDGIPMLDQSYLTYEPIYMKPGKKVEWFWRIIGESVMMYQYSIWNNSKGNGFELLKEVAVK